MTRVSLRLRLALVGVAAICVALAVAGAGFALLFERHVYRTLSDELDIDVRQIIGALQFDTADVIRLASTPGDPRFGEPASGLYWQVTDGTTTLRSRSLWDETLVLPQDQPAEPQTHYHQIAGPKDKLLLVAERRVLVAGQSGRIPVRIVVASDLTRLRQARDAFIAELVPALGLLALVLGAATFAQLSLGLRPLTRLREQVEAVASGRSPRLPEDAPREVLPLVREVNKLLTTQANDMERARWRAANLAHGLKTPLTALAADARLLRDEGRPDIAASIETIGEAMRRHVERELARARIRAGAPHGDAVTPVLKTVEALSRTLARTPEGERVRFAFAIAGDATVPLEKGDLTEVLGNLLENAARHATSHVRVRCETGARGTTICIEDDGPGMDPATQTRARERGARLDSGGAAGLGLSIVQDVLDAYGWRMDFGSSELGGLSVTIGGRD